MKRIIFLLVAGFLCFSVNAQTEFSSPLIGVGVVVKDLDKSVDFYTTIIGMVKTGGFSLDSDFTKRSGLSGGIPFSVVVLKLENSPQANEWKLMSFSKTPDHKKPNFVQDDLGMQYITLNVKTLGPVIERIKQHNVRLLGNTPIPLDEKRFFVLIQDPDGNFIELIGPK